MAVVDVVEVAAVTVELEVVVVLLATAFSSLAAEHPDNPAADRAVRAANPTVTARLRFMGRKRTGEGSHSPATS